METNAMEVKNLSFSYGSNQILSDISLTIPRGKITTIMGANGCGKSTLFSLMTKNLTPGKGKIPTRTNPHPTPRIVWKNPLSENAGRKK